MSKCGIDGCDRDGAIRVARPVSLCDAHKKFGVSWRNTWACEWPDGVLAVGANVERSDRHSDLEAILPSDRPALILPTGMVIAPPLSESEPVAIDTVRFSLDGKDVMMKDATAEPYEDADGRHCIKLRGKVEGKPQAFLFTNVRLDAAKLTTGG